MPTKINNKKLQESFGKFQLRLDNEQNKIERQLLQQYNKALEQIKIEIGKIYERYGDQISTKSYTNLGRLTNIRKQITDNIKQIIKNLYGYDYELTENAIKNFYSLSFNNLSGIIREATGIRLSTGLLSEDAFRAAVKNPYSKIKWGDSIAENINGLNQTVRTEVTQGIIQGNSYGQTAMKLNEKLNIGATRALRIIRTETHRAQNQGFLDGVDATNKAAQTLGVEIERVWQHNSSRDPRTGHIKMNGQIADENGMFHFIAGPNAGEKTAGPGLSGIAEEDINCGCTTFIRIKNL